MELFLTYRTRRPPPVDQDFCIFINGVPSGNILIDASQVATDTIDYVATDTCPQMTHAFLPSKQSTIFPHASVP
jgi:hypothetical protein